MPMTVQNRVDIINNRCNGVHNAASKLLDDYAWEYGQTPSADLVACHAAMMTTIQSFCSAMVQHHEDACGLGVQLTPVEAGGGKD